MALSSTPYSPTTQELKSQFLEDLELQALDAGVDAPPVERGSDWDLLATGIANNVQVSIANGQIYDEDSDILRATGPALDEWRQRLSLPEVLASAAAGTVTVTVLGVGNIPNGLELQAPNGTRIRIPVGAVAVGGAVTCSAVALTTGEDGNLPAGTRVRVVGGPPNLLTEAVIPSTWVGGNPDENDARKRERILSRIRNGGSGWGDVRSTTLDATGAISDAYVYPALGGPGSVKVVVLSSTSGTTRTVAPGTVTEIQSYLDERFPKDIWKLYVQSALDRGVDVSLGLQLPATGSGRWLASGPIATATVLTAASETSFTVAPAVVGALSGNEIIACWDVTAQRFATATVLSVSAGAITTTPWVGGAGPAVGSRICPACESLDAIAAAFAAEMRRMGPGEQVQPTDPRIAFCQRRPLESASYPTRCSTAQLFRVQGAFPQIVNISYLDPVQVPVPPPGASLAPEVLQLNKFGVYPI